jgi:hypothetical protein
MRRCLGNSLSRQTLSISSSFRSCYSLDRTPQAPLQAHQVKPVRCFSLCVLFPWAGLKTQVVRSESITPLQLSEEVDDYLPASAREIEPSVKDETALGRSKFEMQPSAYTPQQLRNGGPSGGELAQTEAAGWRYHFDLRLK